MPQIIASPTTALKIREWNDVVFVKTDSTYRLFLNGREFLTEPLYRFTVNDRLVKFGYSSWSLGLDKNTTIILGGNQDGWNGFEGAFAQVTIWDHALDDNDIMRLSKVDSIFRYKKPRHRGVLATDLLLPGVPDSELYTLMHKKIKQFMKQKLQNDPWFPHYHIAVPANSEDNLPFYHDGVYHMFLCWTPSYRLSDPKFGMNGNRLHLYSEDLLQWHIAKPEPLLDQYHANGCFLSTNSGVLGLLGFVKEDDKPFRIIRAKDKKLLTWEKVDQRQIVFRSWPDSLSGLLQDVHAFKHGDEWTLLVTECITREKNIHCFTSKDLLSYDYKGLFYKGNNISKSVSWNEMQWTINLKGNEYLVSPGPVDTGGRYILGKIDNYRFIKEKEINTPFDHGTCGISSWRGICPITKIDNDRVLSFFMIGIPSGRNVGSHLENLKSGYNTVVCPREVVVRADSSLGAVPLKELAGLRKNYKHFDQKIVTGLQKLPDISGSRYCIKMIYDPGKSNASGIFIGDNQHEIRISYNLANKTMDLILPNDEKMTHNAKDGKISHDKKTVLFQAPLKLKMNEKIDMTIYMDGALCEVFINNGYVLSGYVKFPRPDKLNYTLFADRSSANFESVDVWQMGCIWDDFLK